MKLISNFVVPQPAQQANTLHILTNISVSKGNHTMMFSLLIEYNMKKVFLEKLYTRCDEETIPQFFSKN